MVSQGFMSLSKSKHNGPRGGKGVEFKGFINLMQWNIEGICSTVHGNKLEDDEFIKTIAGQDIIGLTETHVGKGKNLKIPGYRIFKKCRPKSKNAKKSWLLRGYVSYVVVSFRRLGCIGNL